MNRISASPGSDFPDACQLTTRQAVSPGATTCCPPNRDANACGLQRLPLAVIVMLCLIAVSTAANAEEDHQVTWLKSLDQAKQLAQTRRTPILVVGSATWCGPCQMFKEELSKDDVQSELERWIPVRIDVDNDPEAAVELAISSIPAMRALSPDGRLIASQEGFKEAAEFATWLSQQRQLLDDSKVENAAPGKLNALQAIRLLKHLKSRETSVRESAISRLVREPGVSAAAAVASLNDGGLAERLAILDLLSNWNAPIDGLDPWIPATLSTDRLQSLTDWVDERKFEGPQDGELSAAQLLEAERMLDQLADAEPATAVGIREQLARMGAAVMPLVRSRIAATIDPDYRSRLVAARYRIAASPNLAVAWPGGIERLASNDFDDRIQAVSQLASIATRNDEALLLELFSDPAPLVREITLKGLNRVSDVSANSALIGLLGDEDPNVRVAVLNQLAESQDAKIIAPVVKYLETEEDPDLIVHGIRCLQSHKSARALQAMFPLLEHSSWRVRAEAAEGIAGLCEESSLRAGARKEVQAAFQKLLSDEDDYVTGIAIRNVLLAGSVRTADEMLHQIVLQRPELGAAAIEKMTSDGDRLLEFASSESPSIRIAAVKGLIRDSRFKYSGTIQAALRSTQPSVREAIADALFSQVVAAIRERTNNRPNTIGESNESDAVASESTFSRIRNALGLFGGSSSNTTAQPEADVADADAAEKSVEPLQVNENDQQIVAARNSSMLRKWFDPLQDDLKNMLAAEAPAEQFAAARILAAMGSQEAFDRLQQVASQPKYLMPLTAVLPALEWSQRQQLFADLQAAVDSSDSLALLAEGVCEISDPRMEPIIWGLLDHPFCNAQVSAEFAEHLFTYYAVDRYKSYRQMSMRETSGDVSREEKRLTQALTEYLNQGSLWQKTVSLALLPTFDKEAARSKSLEIAEDESQLDQLRSDALRVALGCSDADAAQALATKYAVSENPAITEAAVPFLAIGKRAIIFLSDAIPVSLEREGMSYVYSSGQRTAPTPIVPTAPEGLALEVVQALQQSESMRVAVSADYLAVLLDHGSSTERIIQFWQQNPQDSEIRKMAYRAIAVANRPEDVVHLRRMYLDISSDYMGSMSNFYWTIRIMTGPEILALRKQIRDEKGDELKQDDNRTYF